MIFLVSQIFISLVLAALGGGLIGWSLRARRCASETEALISQRDSAVAEAKALRSTGMVSPDTDVRIVELEEQLSTEKDEVAGLKARLAALRADSKTEAGTDQASEEDDDGSALQWRNRYLESRVRFLEGRIEEFEAEGANLHSVGTSSAPAEDSIDSDDMDVARLKWRNRYLEGRIRYFEEESQNSTNLASEEPVGTWNTPAAAALTTSLTPPSTEPSSKAEPIKSTFTGDKEVDPQASEKKAKKNANKKEKPKKADDAVIESATALTGASFIAAMEKDDKFVAGSEDGKPSTLTGPIFGSGDNLRAIAGVGPKLEKLLHELGVFHFAQIAEWTEKEIDWVDEHLTFKGRIRRENWVAQSKLLAKGDQP